MSKSLSSLLGALPHNQKRVLKKVRYLPSDLWDQLTKRNQSIPPRWLRFDSQSDFEEIGYHLRDLCIEYGALAPEHTVLDIGCGVGRLALPLTQFLLSSSRYEGFDVDGQAIAWCERTITKRHENFTFQKTSVTNDHYNPNGEEYAETFSFPYDSASFDFAVATSVFTHLSSDDAKQYLRELSRVLKPGAKALLTWYVLDESFEVGEERPALSFDAKVDAFSATATPKNPLAAMAFKRDFILDASSGARLTCDGDIRPGTWRASAGPTHQDLLIVQKPAA